MTEKSIIARNAFRKYSSIGLNEISTYEFLRKLVHSNLSNADVTDILSVRDTLRHLKIAGDTEAILAVKEIYFFAADDKLHKNDVSLRVRRFARINHRDDRTVYRAIRRATDLFNLYRKAYESHIISETAA